MEMTGEFRVPAPRDRVWQGLNDPEILKQAIPGCQTIEKVSDTEFTAKVRAKVNLDEDGGDATVLRYEVQAHVGGKLAQIGSRLIDATSRKMAEDFFTRFVSVVSPPAENSEAATAELPGGAASGVAREALAPEPADPQSEAAEAAASPRLSPAVWVTGLTAIVALMLYYFTRHGGVR